MLTPYQFASNMPINSIDLDGLESKIIIEWSHEDYATHVLAPTAFYLDEVREMNDGEFIQDPNDGRNFINFNSLVNKNDKDYQKEGILVVNVTSYIDGTIAISKKIEYSFSDKFNLWKRTGQTYAQNAGIVYYSFNPAGGASAENKTADNILAYTSIDDMLLPTGGGTGVSPVLDFGGLYGTMSTNDILTSKNEKEREAKVVKPIPRLDTFIICDVCSGQEFPISRIEWHSGVREDTLVIKPKE